MSIAVLDMSGKESIHKYKKILIFSNNFLNQKSEILQIIQ